MNSLSVSTDKNNNGKSQSASRGSCEKTVNDLQTELNHLRKEIRESAMRVADKMEAAIVVIAEDLKQIPLAKERRKVCNSAIDRIGKLRIKPRKGRLRDLKRIDELLSQVGRDINKAK